MDNSTLVAYVAVGAWIWGWIVAIWKKLKAVDVKIQLLQTGGNPVVIDVRVGGRRRYDPPAPDTPPAAALPPGHVDD